QVYAWILNASNNVLVLQDGLQATLPGGKPEAGESWRQTLMREVWEEARVTVTEVRYLGYQRVDGDDLWFGGQPSAQLRFAARLEAEEPCGPDPATGRTLTRLWLSPTQAVGLLGWGGPQVAAALRTLPERP
ncbi:MAG: Zn-finger containing pyrophosphohydrolase, partial [Deinococcus sp.]|nr:Zn-finger containing pyrophosphohydrolase [Deinococcus sp.]